jgi:hypothetical protein
MILSQYVIKALNMLSTPFTRPSYHFFIWIVKCNCVVNSSMGWVFVFYYNSQVRVFENINSNNHPNLVFLFLGDLRNHLILSLKTPKRGGYEVGARVKVCD